MAQLANDIVTVTNTFSNTNVNVIAITEDKLVNILTIHVGKLKKNKQWMAALSFCVSLSLVLLTSNFKNMLGLSGEQWQMVFFILLLASVVYLCFSVYNCFMY